MPADIESAYKYRTTRFLPGGSGVGELMIDYFRQTRMTWPVFCRFPFCTTIMTIMGQHGPGSLTEVWTVNYIVPG